MNYLQQLEVNSQRAQYIALNMHAAGAISRFAIGIGNGKPFVVSCDPDLGLPDLIEELRMAANYLEQSDPMDVFSGPGGVEQAFIVSEKASDLAQIPVSLDGTVSENGNYSDPRHDRREAAVAFANSVLDNSKMDDVMYVAILSAIEAILWAREVQLEKRTAEVEIVYSYQSKPIHKAVVFPFR